MRIETGDSGMDEEQAVHAERVRGLWTSHAPLLREAHELRGGIIWKKARGHEYLYRYFQEPSTGRKEFVGLGRRSPETEAEHARYLSRRDAVQASLAQSTPRLENAGRVARALRLARLPSFAGEIIHSLWRDGLMDGRLRVMGSMAMFGYELDAETLVPSPLIRGNSLRFLVQGDIDDQLAEVTASLVTGAGRGFTPSRRGHGHLAFDGQDGSVELHTLASLATELRDRDLDEDRIDVVMETMALPAWQGVAVARNARVVPLVAIDPRAYVLLAAATAATEHDEGRADLLAKRAKFTGGAVLARVGVAFEPHQANLFEPFEADRHLGRLRI
ncbi:MAG: hypothetical protein MIL41_19890 [Hyphomicrobiales bacterium]|jgi:hypothetical protein